MNQFDVAAALYRESVWALYYTDHSAVGAATALPDPLLQAAPACAARLLSAAWHAHNPEHLPLDFEAPYAHLFMRRTPRASSRQPVLQDDAPDKFYKEFSGDKSYTLLMGQKIADHRYEHHTNINWVRSCRATYVWAHTYGLTAALECKRRFKTQHAVTPILWTLESVPPDLINDAEPLVTPDPDVPGACIVLDSDNCYDTVASYRMDLALNKQALWCWRNAKPPRWLEDYKEVV